MKNLFIYNSISTGQLEIINAAIAKHDSEHSFVDINGLSAAAQLTAIQALVNNTYDNVIALCPVSAGGTTTTTLSNFAWAWASLKVKTANKTLVTSGLVRIDSPDTNTATRIELATADAATTNYYRYMMFTVTGGTYGTDDDVRMATAYASNYITVGTVTNTFDATTAYNIYDVSACMYQVHATNTVGNVGFSTYGKNSTYQLWEIIYPGVTKPLAVEMLGGLNTWDKGTSAAGTGTSFTLQATAGDAGSRATATERTTDDFFIGKYICINSGTGAGQARKITDYVGSTLVCTVDKAWDTAPSTGGVYEIVDAVPNTTSDDTMNCFASIALQYFLYSSCKPITSAYGQSLISNLIDADGKLSGMVSGAPAQNISGIPTANVGVAIASYNKTLDNALYVGKQIIRSLNIANITTTNIKPNV